MLGGFLVNRIIIIYKSVKKSARLPLKKWEKTHINIKNGN